MSTSDSTGVVDTNLRLYGLTNTYICSSAVFPCSGFSNPTHTAPRPGHPPLRPPQLVSKPLSLPLLFLRCHSHLRSRSGGSAFALCKRRSSTPQVNSNPTMQTIPLANTTRQTTRLGFGCGSLMGATNRRDSLKLLEAAYEAGIRHFDVAPMYGYGEAESCLGEFLQHHHGQITVTTKFGIAPPKKSAADQTGPQHSRPSHQTTPQPQAKPRACRQRRHPQSRAPRLHRRGSQSLPRPQPRRPPHPPHRPLAPPRGHRRRPERRHPPGPSRSRSKKGNHRRLRHRQQRRQNPGPPLLTPRLLPHPAIRVVRSRHANTGQPLRTLPHPPPLPHRQLPRPPHRPHQQPTALSTLVRIDQHRPEQPRGPRSPHAQSLPTHEPEQHHPLLLQKTNAHPGQRPHRRRHHPRTPRPPTLQSDPIRTRPASDDHLTTRTIAISKDELA